MLTDVCVCVCVLYNKHWSTTGPSCQVTAVTANNDYPLPASQSLFHYRQTHRRSASCRRTMHPWVGLIITPRPLLSSLGGASDRTHFAVWISAYLSVSVFFLNSLRNTHLTFSLQVLRWFRRPSGDARLYTNQYISLLSDDITGYQTCPGTNIFIAECTGASHVKIGSAVFFC